METRSTPFVVPTTVPPDIAQLTGPIFVGQLFNALLFGVLTVQTYIYYLSFPGDRKLPKILVSWVYVLEMVQLILSMRDGFRLFGSGWGDMKQVFNPGLLGLSVPILSCLISCTVQVFYAWRIWVLGSRLFWLPVLIVILAAIQVAAGMWCGVATFVINDLAELQAKTHISSSIWAGGTAFCDVIIAISMLWFLSKSRSGFRHTNILLARIIRVTIETGMICAVFAIIDLSLFLAFESKNYYLTFAIALSKLYSNSLLVVLNSRMRIMGGRFMGSLTPDDYSLSIVLERTGDRAYPSRSKTMREADANFPRSINVTVSRHIYNETPTLDKPGDTSQRSDDDEISEVDRQTLDKIYSIHDSLHESQTGHAM